MFGVKLVIFLACLSWSQCKFNKYCSICRDHTLCKYKGVGSECKGEGDFGVTEKDIIEIVGTHNWLRGIVASGSEKKGAGGPQPKAANLMKLEWDNDLAEVAQRWADQCHFYHDACRDDPRWKVGQNIYWAWKYPKHVANWTEAIFSWYNEVSLYNPEEVGSFRFEASTGHYTQMLWHDTTSIGCGRRDYGPSKLYVCNYGPAGNWVDEPVYEVGEPCSKCPKGTRCNSYLCDAQKPTTEFHAVDSRLLRTLPEPDTQNSTDLSSQKFTKEPPKTEPKLLDESPESDNETKNLESLQPPEENAKDVYESELNKETDNRNENEAKQDHQLLQPLPYSESTVERKSTTNSIDETGYELDLDMMAKIEGIRRQIENLVKFALKKSDKKP